MSGDGAAAGPGGGRASGLGALLGEYGDVDDEAAA